MTLKKYKYLKLVIIIALAVIFSQAYAYQNFYLASGVLITASLIMYLMRKKVKDVLADERDYEYGGKAALLAMQVYCWIGVVAMFILKSMANFNPVYDVIATTLAFSVCIFMLLYSFIYYVKSKAKFWNKWTIYTLIVLLLFIAMGVLAVLKA